MRWPRRRLSAVRSSRRSPDARDTKRPRPGRCAGMRPLPAGVGFLLGAGGSLRRRGARKRPRSRALCRAGPVAAVLSGDLSCYNVKTVLRIRQECGGGRAQARSQQASRDEALPRRPRAHLIAPPLLCSGAGSATRLRRDAASYETLGSAGLWSQDRLWFRPWLQSSSAQPVGLYIVLEVHLEAVGSKHPLRAMRRTSRRHLIAPDLNCKQQHLAGSRWRCIAASYVTLGHVTLHILQLPISGAGCVWWRDVALWNALGCGECASCVYRFPRAGSPAPLFRGEPSRTKNPSGYRNRPLPVRQCSTSDGSSTVAARCLLRCLL